MKNKNKTMKHLIKKLFAIIGMIGLVGTSVLPAFAQQDVQLVVLSQSVEVGEQMLIMASGPPNQLAELRITNPYNATVIQNIQLNENGILQYWYSQTANAGRYHIAYGEQVATVDAHPGQPDARYSTFQLSDYTTSQGSTIQASGVLKDRFGNRIANEQLTFHSRRNSQISCHGECRTRADGTFSVAITTQQQGLERIQVAHRDQVLFQEDIGVFPLVRNPRYQYGSQQAYGAGYNTHYPHLNHAQGHQDFLPVYDPTRALPDAQGNNDQFLNDTFFDSRLLAQSEFNFGDWYDYMSANSLTPPPSAPSNPVPNLPGLGATNLPGTNSNTGSTPPASPTTTALNTTSAGAVAAFQIFLDEDPNNLSDTYEETITKPANTALDARIKAVDANGNVVPTHTGQVEFEVLPTGSFNPPDVKTYSALDQGVLKLPLAFIFTVLPAGQTYTLRAFDPSDPTIEGEIEVTAELSGSALPPNSANITLSVSNAPYTVYAGPFILQGSTSTDNTEVTVREGGIEIGKVDVDQDKNFQLQVSLSDGPHTLEIEAHHLPTSSKVNTSLDIEVDQTPPAVDQVVVPDQPVRAGETFTITATTLEDDVNLTAFINNRSYVFSADGMQHTLTTQAPLAAGTYPVSIRAEDQAGNQSDNPDEGNLIVTAALEEITNLFGIPSVGAITLSWDPIDDAASYDVSYQSVLGTSQESLTSTAAQLTIENLSENVSYIFTVTAKDDQGNDLSLPSRSRALRTLEAVAVAPTAPTTPSVPAVGGAPGQPAIHAAPPEVQTTPIRHSQTGPEVYVFVLVSLILLHFYGKARKALTLS